MGRFLGIDYGLRRIGLALSDPLSMFATPLETILNTGEKQVLKTLETIIQQHDVEGIVLGLPLKTSGDMGVMAEHVQAFGKRLQAYTQLSLTYEDERFTSSIATQSLIAQGIKPSQKKGFVDKTSAAIILQCFLDKRSRQNATEGG